MIWILVLGLVTFFAIHSVRIVADGWRTEQIAINPGRWKGIYSLVSLLGFALIIWGWIVYRPEAPQVFEPPEWGRYAALALVWPAFVLLVASNTPPGYIKSVVKHPMLLGVILWALGHLLANGDLASLLLFGAFLLYSVVDRIAVTSRGDPAPAAVSVRGDVLAVAIGTVVYLVLLWLHPFLFGAAPLPS